MTINEAVRLIQADINDESAEWNSPLGDAYRLGFEALKRVNGQREWGLRHAVIYIALPGETEE